MRDTQANGAAIEPMTSRAISPNSMTISVFRGALIVLVVAVVGFSYVKWMPYYQKALAASTTHSIGAPILLNKAGQVPAPSFASALDYAFSYSKAIWKAMVLGLVLGSAVQALLPTRWIVRTLGRSGMSQVLLSGVLSLPSMMCTCCAAPVVAGLRESRAAPGNAVAYWTGNTMLNPATLVFTAFVLGGQWLILRLVVGLSMVVGLGWIVNRLVHTEEVPTAEPDTAPEDRPSIGRWLRLLWRMAIRLIPEYAIIVLLLGATRAWLFPHIGPEVDNSLGWILAFALAGAVFVIPTAGEIPIVQALLALGVGVGPAAALLVTLSPVSAPSVAMLWRALRPATLIIVSAGVVLLGIVGGIAAVAFFIY
jgi:uncharacterized membrane protein YraQ (UPF0718 family)